MQKTNPSPESCHCRRATCPIFLFDSGDYNVFRCNACSQVFVTGIKTESLYKLYQNSDNFVEKNRYLKRWEELSVHFQILVDKIKRFQSSGALLDIGCGIGILLDVAKNNGFSAEGVEISEWAASIGRSKGLNVFCGSLVEARYPDGAFDVVVMNHVLEHLTDPVATLFEVRRILRDSGFIVVGVPNFGSFMAQIKKAKWVSLQPDQHIWQFSHYSLDRLLRKCGFQEFYFEAKENHTTLGWGFKSALRRLIGYAAVILNRSEAMVSFSRKTA